MAIIYNKYVNCIDHTWYDSSNVVYSECYDNSEEKKTVKIVFKGGRAYIYTDVLVEDYIMFKNSDSNGVAVNTYIVKKYKDTCKRLPDIDMNELEEKKENFINEGKITEEAFTNLAYAVVFKPSTNEFALKLNGNTIFEGTDGQVSIFKLLKSMNINFRLINAEAEDEGVQEN